MNFDAVEALVAYHFRDPGLLRLALTHRSAAPESGRHNERLEFFGDAIVGMVVSEYLYSAYPALDEGGLTRIKGAAVSRETFARVLRGHNFRENIYLGKEISPAAELPDSIYANVFEAVVAAVYFDGGNDYAAARAVTLRLLGGEIANIAAAPRDGNPKAVLQNWAQLRGGEITYTLLARKGADHCPVFTVAAVHAGETLGKGVGRSKKEAEREAARAALERVKRPE